MIYRADHQSVKVMGRTLYKGGVRYLGNSASYIEFSFTGTRASARLVVSNDADTSEMRACMAVIVNDEEDKAKREVLADGEWEMELFVCERPETVTIRLQKLSESKYGIVGIRQIQTDGEIFPLPYRERRIEFVGDSITCGYGVEGRRDGGFATREENPLKAYAARCAKELGADYQLVARSGIGVLSNWIEASRQTPDTVDLMPDLYPYTDLYAGRALERVWPSPLKTGRQKPGTLREGEWELWDASAFRPQLVVIHLGNNDASYVREDPERERAFEREYANFLKQVQERNPDAAILCALGLFGPELCPAVRRCVRKAGGNVFFFQFPRQDPKDGLGTGDHPGPLCQQKASGLLTAQIRRIMNWPPAHTDDNRLPGGLPQRLP